ncbi:MAG: (Fe-S)-binding protein [Dehalococcoidia bacterium]|nr:(Fe-S)-binding protein [Dehalococcoidia bacterium]
MIETGKYQFGNVDNCMLCGECLSRCPELNLPLTVAKQEKLKINRGEISRHVSQACTGCFNCDTYCPNQANPCETIVNHWWEVYRSRGLLERARYFQPLEQKNFRNYVTHRLPPDEKARLSSWDDTSPCEEFIYPGCNVCTVPYLTDTSLLPKIPIRGGPSWCCGETYFRTGCYDLAEAQGRRMQARFAEMGAKNILMMCTAGTFLFSKVMPERLGMKFDAKFKPLVSYLWEELESGRIKIERKLNLRATLQDSCYSKFLEPDYIELPRKILQHIGVEVIEMPRSRDRMVCCGIGAGFSIESCYNTIDLTRSTLKRLHEAKKTGADILCVYCAGCLQMLGSGSLLYPGTRQIYHLLELVQMATGEVPQRRIRQRSVTMFSGMLVNQAPKLLSRSRFKPTL